MKSWVKSQPRLEIYTRHENCKFSLSFERGLYTKCFWRLTVHFERASRKLLLPKKISYEWEMHHKREIVFLLINRHKRANRGKKHNEPHEISCLMLLIWRLTHRKKRKLQSEGNNGAWYGLVKKVHFNILQISSALSFQREFICAT